MTTLKEFLDNNINAKLDDAISYQETATRLMSTDMIVSYLDNFRLIQHFKNSDKSAEMATMLAISGSAEFNFIVGSTVGDKHLIRLDDIINDVDVVIDTSTKTIDGNELTLAQRLTAFKQAVINYCNYTVYPFSETTLAQFNQAKGIFTEKEVKNYNGQNIKITFNSEYDCTATTWKLTEFGYENFGKLGHVKAGIALTKITTNNKKATGTLYVRVPFENADCTVEIV